MEPVLTPKSVWPVHGVCVKRHRAFPSVGPFSVPARLGSPWKAGLVSSAHGDPRPGKPQRQQTLKSDREREPGWMHRRARGSAGEVGRRGGGFLE